MRKFNFRKKFFNYPFKRTQIFVLTFILLFCFRIKFSYIKNATYYQMMRNLSEYKCRKKNMYNTHDTSNTKLYKQIFVYDPSFC